ncbi:hypothetical protein BJ741DRAFT_672908 [Chytriomyces cf. hyalinus JEL632]|nr:hypothetical protein BJ741DRAFT_672908 [Chytriomyces cf. hyalinus JEL632]
MTSAEKSVWLTRNEIVILGFTGPLFLALCVPILGPAVYFALANSASARLCLELFDEVDLVEREDSIPGVPSRGLCEPRLEFMYGAGFFNAGLDVAGKADVLVQKFVVWLSVKAEDVLKRFEAVQYVDMWMQKVAAFLRKLEGRELEGRDSGVKRDSLSSIKAHLTLLLLPTTEIDATLANLSHISASKHFQVPSKSTHIYSTGHIFPGQTAVQSKILSLKLAFMIHAVCGAYPTDPLSTTLASALSGFNCPTVAFSNELLSDPTAPTIATSAPLGTLSSMLCSVMRSKGSTPAVP